MFVIDRIEEGIAVIIDDTCEIIKVKSSAIEGNVREGAVVENKGGLWVVDDNRTAIRRDAMQKRLDRLFGN